MKKNRLFLCLLPLLLSCSRDDVPIPSIELRDDNLTFMIASDVHYLDPSLIDESASPLNGIDVAGDGKMSYYSSTIFDTLVEEVKEKKPDALILTGDNTFNGAKASHDGLIEKLKSIQKEGMPVYVLAGNHDVGHYQSLSYKNNHTALVDSYKQDEFKNLYARFGYKQAEYQDPNSDTYVKEIGKNIYGIMLDCNVSSTYTIKEETLSWLEGKLNELSKKDATLFSFSHQTLLTQVDSMVDGWKIINADKVLDIYSKYNVKANFAGHMHIQHYVEENGFLEILTSALSVNPCQYGLLTLSDGAWNYSTKRLDITAYSKKMGYVEENLLNFSSFADSFFDETNSKKLSSFVYKDDSLDDASKEKYSDTIAMLNKAFFVGEPLEIDEDKNADIETLKAYLKSKENNDYLLEIIEEIKEGHDYTKKIL